MLSMLQTESQFLASLDYPCGYTRMIRRCVAAQHDGPLGEVTRLIAATYGESRRRWGGDDPELGIPTDPPMTLLAGRHWLLTNYAFAIPGRDAILGLSWLSPLVEIGAGRGYWARTLRREGADVLAYDWRPGKGNDYVTRAKPWTSVLRGGATAAGLHPGRTLFLCWPPHDTPMAYDAARFHHSRGGEMIAYLGDHACCGSDRFHAFLDERYVLEREIGIPMYPGLNDWLGIYRRK